MFCVKGNEQFDLICNDITLKHSSHEKNLGVAVDNKFSLMSILLSVKQLTKNSTFSVE